MNRKSLILCLSVLASMVLVVAAAVALLYYDADKKPIVKSRYQLLQAIPSNAVAVVCLSELSDLDKPVFEGFEFLSSLADKLSEGLFQSLAHAPMAMSLHYSGKLAPLYVIDAGAASLEPSSDVLALLDFARKSDLYASYLDCSTIMDGYEGMATRSLIMIAETESLIKSSSRHLQQSLSVMEAAGFTEASKLANSSDVLFVPYAQIKPLYTGVFARKYSSLASFAGTFGDWAVLDIADTQESISLTGAQLYEDDASEFMTVLESLSSSTSTLSTILPSYTTFALSFPINGAENYVEAYGAYLDSKQQLSNYNHRQNQLKAKSQISPQEFVKRIGVQEVATAYFGSSDNMYRVNLVKCANKDTVIFRGTGVKSFKAYEPQVHEYRFPSYLGSVFGDYFKIEDESCFTYINGWLITGSSDAIYEYQSGRALSYTLVEYMADAGEPDLLAQRKSSMVLYADAGAISFMEEILTKDAMRILSTVTSGTEYAPLVLSAYVKDGHVCTDIELFDLSMHRVQAPEFERDTVVVVPSGPFKVKNSATGKNNFFYQNSHGAICLQEEDGKGLWGVPFGKPLCGTAQNVDYYANGKLQIIFGSGSDIYIIDRLGRFVSGFPISLGKEILIGPDVYDFNGSRAYNIMVLHKDNTIEMYNLKGNRPASWQTISAPETIKSLPEKIEVGGSTFWVVRTSIQTLIYPFLGGEPVTDFEGQKMILPSSKVTVVDLDSVQVECYDGQVRTLKLK